MSNLSVFISLHGLGVIMRKTLQDNRVSGHSMTVPNNAHEQMRNEGCTVVVLISVH